MNTTTPRVALITGGARGIGASIVERLAADGAKIAFTYAGAHDAADGLAERLNSTGADVIAIQADSADEPAIAGAVDQTIRRFGGIDVLVNNAGGGTFGPLHEQSVEEIDRMLFVNVRGVILATRAVVPHLGDGGRIINIGSANADRTPFPGGSIYSTTKGAVASFTRALSRELGPRGITINNVQPGPIDTETNPADGPGSDFLKSFIALGRFGHVDDVSGLVAYLASEQGRFVTGASITVDGGFTG